MPSLDCRLRALNIEVAGIATVILSVGLIAYVAFFYR
jgi:hypothetical protein